MPYGYAKEAPPQNTVRDYASQEATLRALAELAQRATIDPLVRATAIKIVRDCRSREDDCELKAIFNAVKNGDPEVAPLARGFKYINDPRYADYFVSPIDTLRMCLKGVCGSDCDDHTSLITALAGSIGWKVGLRAWGTQPNAFSHVYAVVAYPKRPPFERAIALDTTVPESRVGWEPPHANVLTAWLE